MAQPLNGRDVLEVGCGTGTDSVLLAANGARVFAYDVSREAVRIATERARAHGLARRVQFRVACSPAEAYPGQRFDVIFGNAVLHHLNLDEFMKSLRCCMHPQTVCVFREPVVLSTWLRWLRRCIPWYPNGRSPDERPLGLDELSQLARQFHDVQVYPFEVCSRLWHLCRSRFVIRGLHQWDAAALEKHPWLRSVASAAVLRLARPIRLAEDLERKP